MRPGSVRYGSLRFDPIRSVSARFGSLRFDPARFDPSRLDSAWFALVWPIRFDRSSLPRYGPDRSDSVRLALVRFGLMRFASARSNRSGSLRFGSARGSSSAWLPLRSRAGGCGRGALRSALRMSRRRIRGGAVSRLRALANCIRERLARGAAATVAAPLAPFGRVSFVRMRGTGGASRLRMSRGKDLRPECFT